MNRWEGLLELLYPALRCDACGQRLAARHTGLLCDACAESLTPLAARKPCPHCGRPDSGCGCIRCLGEPVYALDVLYAAYEHAGAARELVHGLKFNGLRTAARSLTPGMADLLASLQAGQAEYDALVPIPLHKRRERERGYNQAKLLAEGLASYCGLPVWDAMLRIRSTQQQSTLHAQSRHQNLRGAFSVVTPLHGRRILLIDDVCTTGATAETAAVACKQAGAARVGLLTATRSLRSL